MSIDKIICRKFMLFASKERCLRMGSNSIILCIILIMLLSSSHIIESARVIDKNIPFYPGEKLTYEGKWGIIPAGEVTLEVLPKETINGVEAYHFAMITKTNAAVDLLYKIRERQDSYVDAKMTRSVLYKKRTESRHPRDVVINFNWEKLQATYTNFGKNAAPINILPGSFDPLALFFILRLQDLIENSVIEIPITDGNMNIRVKATIGKKDLIEIKGKTYKSVAVTPDMEQLENIVKKSENPQLKIWFSADEKKIPLKIQSKVGIVSFIFEFVSMVP
ncbi:MAG: DUF3108 domain-containing protein [Syntrophales bacterium]|nr:DUF3108 domain-containing protein [Syntrophales bacterium]